MYLLQITGLPGPLTHLAAGDLAPGLLRESGEH